MRRLYATTLVAMLCISLSVPLLCRASPVWSDNFDDLNYDGWTVMNGTFTAADGTLRPTGLSSYYIIVHPSSVTTGTWSFDVTGLLDTATPYYETRVLFMCVKPVPYAGWNGMGVPTRGGDSRGGHAHYIEVFGSVAGEDQAWDLGDAKLPSDTDMLAWQHIDITRSSDGRICVYVNGTLLLDVTDTRITTSNYFCFATSLSASAIDNIVVSDTVDIQPPPRAQPPPFYMQPIFWGPVGVAVVGAIVLVILYLRKKSDSRFEVVRETAWV